MGHYTVIGSGSIGRRHYENLTRLGADARLLGWRDLNAETLADALEGATGAVIAHLICGWTWSISHLPAFVALLATSIVPRRSPIRSDEDEDQTNLAERIRFETLR